MFVCKLVCLSVCQQDCCRSNNSQFHWNFVLLLGLSVRIIG